MDDAGSGLVPGPLVPVLHRSSTVLHLPAPPRKRARHDMAFGAPTCSAPGNLPRLAGRAGGWSPSGERARSESIASPCTILTVRALSVEPINWLANRPDISCSDLPAVPPDIRVITARAAPVTSPSRGRSRLLRHVTRQAAAAGSACAQEPRRCGAALGRPILGGALPSEFVWMAKQRA